MGFLLFATEITGVGPRGSLLQDHPAGFGLEFHMDLPVVWLATSNHEIHVLNPWFPWEIEAISMDFPWISLPGSVVLSFPTQFQGIRGWSHGSKGNHQTCLFRSLDHEDLAISRRKMAILGKNMEKKYGNTGVVTSSGVWKKWCSNQKALTGHSNPRRAPPPRHLDLIPTDASCPASINHNLEIPGGDLGGLGGFECEKSRVLLRCVCVCVCMCMYVMYVCNCM